MLLVEQVELPVKSICKRSTMQINYVIFNSTGMAGMEAAFVNIVEPGDRVLVLENGIWGARAQDIAGRCGNVAHNNYVNPCECLSCDYQGAQVASLLHEPGIPFTIDEVEMVRLLLCHF